MAAPKVKFKRSSVAGKRPSLANLETGELALNTYDGNLFTVQDTGGVGIATTITLLNPWQESYGGGTITYSGDVNLDDNGKLQLGDGQDLQIYHDGTHSYIDDAGTGNLHIRSGTLAIQNLAGSKTSALFNSGSGQEFYYNNTKRLETTNFGANVVGVLTATSFSGDGSQLTNVRNNFGILQGDFRIGTGFTDFKFTGAGVSSIVGSGNTVTIDIPASTIRRQVETSTGVTTDFTITNGYGVGFIDVYLNGVKQRGGTDYLAISGTGVTMTPAVNDGDVLEFQIYENLTIASQSDPYDGTEGQLLQHNGSNFVGVGSTAFSDHVINEGQGYYAYTTDYYTVGTANTTQEIEEGVWTLVQPQVASNGLYNHQPGPMFRCNNGNPWIGAGATVGTGQTEFSLAGTAPGTSCIVRSVIRFEPDTDETDLDMRLHFTTNTATQGTGLTNFNIEKQALVMTVGAAVTYTSETLISFFVGDTLYGDTKADAGSFCVEVNGTTDGTLEVLSLTVMTDI